MNEERELENFLERIRNFDMSKYMKETDPDTSEKIQVNYIREPSISKNIGDQFKKFANFNMGDQQKLMELEVF